MVVWVSALCNLLHIKIFFIIYLKILHSFSEGLCYTKTIRDVQKKSLILFENEFLWKMYPVLPITARDFFCFPMDFDVGKGFPVTVPHTPER